MIIGNIVNRGLSVKRSIVQNQHTLNGIFKGRNEDMLKPSFKQVTVHRTAKCKRRYNLATIFCGHNAGSGKMHTADFSDNFFSARGIAIFPRIIFIKTAFISILQFAVFRQCFYFGEKLFPFLLVAFDVLNCVFLRVIPRTFFALRIPETLQ